MMETNSKPRVWKQYKDFFFYFSLLATCQAGLILTTCLLHTVFLFKTNIALYNFTELQMIFIVNQITLNLLLISEIIQLVE